jgi:hypothetical protein
MSTYLVLLHESEAEWQATPPDARTAAYAAQEEFTTACAAGGHAILHAHELAPAASALLVRRVASAPVVSEGPYAEAVEQLSGYYLIDTPDVQELARLVAEVLGSGCAELRPVAT